MTCRSIAAECSEPASRGDGVAPPGASRGRGLSLGGRAGSRVAAGGRAIASGSAPAAFERLGRLREPVERGWPDRQPAGRRRHRPCARPCSTPGGTRTKAPVSSRVDALGAEEVDRSLEDVERLGLAVVDVRAAAFARVAGHDDDAPAAGLARRRLAHDVEATGTRRRHRARARRSPSVVESVSSGTARVYAAGPVLPTAKARAIGPRHRAATGTGGRRVTATILSGSGTWPTRHRPRARGGADHDAAGQRRHGPSSPGRRAHRGRNGCR